MAESLVPDEFDYYYAAFLNDFGTPDKRRLAASRLLDPGYRRHGEGILQPSLPSDHLGYNFLFSGWNDTSAELRHAYFLLQQALTFAESAELGTRIVLSDFCPMDTLESLFPLTLPTQSPEAAREFQVINGYLAAQEVGFKFSGNSRQPASELEAVASLHLSQVTSSIFSAGWETARTSEEESDIAVLVSSAPLSASIYYALRLQGARQIWVEDAADAYLEQLRDTFQVAYVL